MIFQSLIRDGDINLANTLPEDSPEYHQIEDVRPHLAPVSPEGKLHNTHPAGISALIVRAYWVGLRFLDHPRLAAALAISLLTALAVFFSYAFLRKVRFDASVAGVVSAVAGTSPLLFLYSNQIYPDVAALVFMLPALISALDTHPVRSKAIVLGCVVPVLLLPILHPRLLLLTCLLLWMRVAALPTRDFLIRASIAFT